MEPTSALTFYELLLRVAIKTGMAYYGPDGQQKAMVPIDPHNLDVCKRIVNDGFRLFESSQPPRGWHWKNRVATILFYPDGNGPDNIDGDPSRYMLPADFGGFTSGNPTYVAGTSHNTQISWTDPLFIDRRKQTSVQSGYPMFAAVRPYGPSSPPALSSTRRWELVVDPKPVSADTIQFPYTSSFNKMDAETGVATGGSATSLSDSTRGEPNDYFKGWVLTVIAGKGKGESATVTGYTGATGTFTFTALSGGSTPDATSVYYVEPVGNIHPAGFQFDFAVEAAVLAKAEQTIEEINEGLTELYYKVHLPQAHAIDGLSRPRTVGNLNRRCRPMHRRIWANVTTEHDI